jgi:hypothetical protein
MKYSTVLSACAFACALAGVSAPAVAKQCPAGQILRVSKGACMDKAEAIKNGFVKSGAVASHDASRARLARLTEQQAAPAGEETEVAKTVSPEAAAAPVQQSASIDDALGFAARPRDQIAANRVSPYGALNLDYFGRR